MERQQQYKPSLSVVDEPKQEKVIEKTPYQKTRTISDYSDLSNKSKQLKDKTLAGAVDAIPVSNKEGGEEVKEQA